MRVLVLRLLRVKGPGALRKMATPTPPPSSQLFTRAGAGVVGEIEDAVKVDLSIACEAFPSGCPALCARQTELES